MCKKKGTQIRFGDFKATQTQSKMVSYTELQKDPISHVWTTLCSQLARLN